MNITEMDAKVIVLINDKSVSGNLTSATDVNRLDYSLRFRDLYDITQKEIATIKHIKKTKKISQIVVPNQLVGTANSTHYTTDITYTAKGSKAYYLEVDNLSDIYIEEETSPDTWTNLKTINHTTPVGEFVAYKGLLSPSVSTNNVRIRFSGAYLYNLRNIALYGYTFASESVVQPYTDYISYDMGDYFYQLDKIIAPDTDDNYMWEDYKTLGIKRDSIGEYKVLYYAYPQTINNTTLETYDFEVDREAQEAIPYYVAFHVLMDEQGKTNVTNKLWSLYQNKLMNLNTTDTTTSNVVINRMFRG